MKIIKLANVTCLLACMALCPVTVPDSQACSRVVHTSTDRSFVVTGRNMDWFEDIDSNIWAFPRGLKREGATAQNSAKWTAKYGSVIVAGFDVGTTDGLNEEGLMVNMLYLGEADFGKRDAAKPGISWSAYAQYLLDNFATVAEAVEGSKDDHIQVVSSPLPGSVSKPPTLHWSLSDKTGDSAIFEHLDGKLVIHHDKKYRVMTNSPTFEQQIALNAYWATVGGDAMLPGTRRASDRFVRASYYVEQLPNPKDSRQAIANVMSIMRNVSVPFGATDPTKPNIAPTIWRTVADHVSKVYYFESTLSPFILWVDLSSIDFQAGKPVQKLELVGNYNLSGNVNAHLKNAEPFAFAGSN